jgi:dihydrofolate reductase
MTDSVRISLIVAASEDDAIGKDNNLLWHLPNDMKFFKNTTWAMPVVMGRKTYASMGSKPLPGRFNIVVTRQSDFDPGDDRTWVVNSLEAALEKAAETNCREVFIAGGGELYQAAMPIADRIYITRVHASYPDADVRFPAFDDKDWHLTSRLDFPSDERHAHAYSFQVWDRRRPADASVD